MENATFARKYLIYLWLMGGSDCYFRPPLEEGQVTTGVAGLLSREGFLNHAGTGTIFQHILLILTLYCSETGKLPPELLISLITKFSERIYCFPPIIVSSPLELCQLWARRANCLPISHH